MKDDADDRPRQRMKDVSHTPPTGDSVTNVWDRGEERPADDQRPASD